MENLKTVEGLVRPVHIAENQGKIIGNSQKKIERIMLISPPGISLKGSFKYCTVPLGLACLGAMVEKAGYNTKLLDAVVEDITHEENVDGKRVRYGLSFEEIEKRIRKFNPCVLGITCLFSFQFENVLKIAEIAKKISPKIVVVVGGEHAGALPKEFAEEKNIDFVILGEGEISFINMLNELQGERNFSKVDGLAYIKNGKIKINPKMKFIENLDDFPLPARHLLPMEKYFEIALPHGLSYTQKRNTAVMTSRGCPGKCVFCASTHFWGMRFRARSPKNVLDELEQLVKKYGVKEVSFIDDNLTADKERAMKIFQGMIDRKFNLSWCAPNGIALWTLDESLIKKMKESGCYMVDLAIESGNQEVLNKIIKKPVNLDKVREVVALLKKHGILAKALFVIGFPGETKVQIQDTFNFAKELDLDGIGIAIATPLPGSELYDICKKKGFLRKGFDKRAIEFYVGNIVTDEFTPKELESMLSSYMLSYNLSLAFRHPTRFFKRFSALMFGHPKMMAGYLVFLLKRMASKVKS